MVVMLEGAIASAQVACDNPDNLCTGDPCVMGPTEVVSPCVVDFGTRALWISGTLRVPNDGMLTLSAGSIQVLAAVSGHHLNSAEGDGADITLNALGSLEVVSKITAGGKITAGSITLDAGGDLDVQGRLYVIGRGAAPAGGAITLDATGIVTVARPLRALGSGKTANGGNVTVRGAGGVILQKFIDTKGKASGGIVTVESTAGSVSLERIMARGRTGGGSILIQAANDIVIGERFYAGATKSGAGGSILISSTAGSVTVDDRLFARGTPGGSIELTGGTSVTVNDDIEVDSTKGVGGTIRLDAASAQVSAGARLLAEGATGGGSMRMDATAGNLTLSGGFVAGGGSGIIEGVASGDLTANGNFVVQPNGCIGLSAGGTLDTSGGTFDTPVVASCSPSGAFLD